MIYKLFTEFTHVTKDRIHVFSIILIFCEKNRKNPPFLRNLNKCGIILIFKF